MTVDSSDPDVIRESNEHPRRTVVVAALIDDRGLMLMVLTRRLPCYWQPVGGGLKPCDLSLAAALQRGGTRRDRPLPRSGRLHACPDDSL